MAKKNGKRSSVMVSADKNKENASPAIAMPATAAKTHTAGTGASSAKEDRYAALETRKSALSVLTPAAKARVAATPPVKENIVPVGQRASDKRKMRHFKDGLGVEHLPVHDNVKNGGMSKVMEEVAKAKAAEKKAKKDKEMSKKKDKAATTANTPARAESASNANGKQQSAAVTKDDNSFFLRRLQQLANEKMEKEISKNTKRSRRERDLSESEDPDAEEAPVAATNGTAPRTKKRKLASGAVVETPEYDVEELPYTVEEPDEDGMAVHRVEMVGRVKKRREARKSDFSNVDFAALNKQFDKEMGPYDEDEDEDFVGDEEEDEDEDDMSEISDVSSLSSLEVDEDELESDTAVISKDSTKKKRKARKSDFSTVDFAAVNEQLDKETGPYNEEEDEDFVGDEEEEEDDDDDMEDEDEDEDEEELASDEIDEDDIHIRPEDIIRVIGDDDDDEDGEGEELTDEECEGEEIDDSDEEMDDEDEDEDEEDEDEDEVDTSDSSHVSDDSYQEAFVDDGMGSKSIVLSRDDSPAATSIDFLSHPFAEEDSRVSAARALNYLLSPCDAQTFFDDAFQANALVIRRNDKHYYGNLFSNEQMTKILRENCLEYGKNVNVALYLNGVRTTHNGTGRAYPLAIGDSIRAGCSVQLTNPQAYSNSIWYLCDALQEVFHCFVGANTYLTPAGASGFAPHWDEIDAFLLQVEGRKYWRVWGPESAETELPLESSGNFTEKDMEGRQPAFEGWLETGDMIYIPRGFIHQARTDATVHSLHVTISAGRQWTFSNVLQKILPQALEAFTDSRPKLRRQLPPSLLDMSGVAELPDGYAAEEAGVAKFSDVLDRHLSKLRHFVSSTHESAIDLMAREFMRTALPPSLTKEEMQLSAWGNEHADLFNEKGASRIGKKSEIRFIRRHGQRVLFGDAEHPFIAHRMANSRTYEEYDERTFVINMEEEAIVGDLLSAYPDWTPVSSIKMKKADKEYFLEKLFNNGLIMVRTP